MNLKILSTIAAISATTTYASSLTCGDVQALYQDAECCSANANGQSCVKSLSIAADSSGFTTLSNGELSINLSAKADASLLADKLSIDRTDPNWNSVPSNLKTTRLWNTGTFDLDGRDDAIDWTGCIGCSESGALWSALWQFGNNDFRLGQTDAGPNPAPDHSDKFGKTVFLALGAKHQISSFAPNINLHGNTHFHEHPSGPGGYTTRFYGDVQFKGSSVWSATAQFVVSDERIKKNIADADIEEVLQKVRDIELKKYDYRLPDKKATWGYIAQQVRQIYPEATSVVNAGNMTLDGEKVEISDLVVVAKGKISELHHGAIQALDAKIATLEARLAALEGQ